MKHEQKLKIGDSVVIKNHAGGTWDPKYKEDYRVVDLKGVNTVYVKDSRGHLRQEHIANLKKVEMTEKIAARLTEQETFGRQARIRLNPQNIPDLGWELADEVNTDFAEKQPATPPTGPRTRSRAAKPVLTVEEIKAIAVEEVTEVLQVQRQLESEASPAKPTEPADRPRNTASLVLGCSVCSIHNINFLEETQRGYRRRNTLRKYL